MKKSKFITGLSAAFVSAMALVSCGTIRADGEVVLYYDGIAYTAEKLFEDQLYTPDAAQACFNAVYKVAVRDWANKQSASIRKEIENETNTKMSSAKETARSNADKNKTSYDVEFKKILSSNGVDSESKLYDKFEYEIQKTKFEDKFYERNYEQLRAAGTHKFINESGEVQGKREFEGYLSKKVPYHMRHILVKLDASENFSIGTIAVDKAQKLARIVEALAEGNLSFGQIANAESDDEGSAKNNGSLGIMDLDTSFVDEFKLGTYMYEAFFGSSTQSYKDQSTSQTDYNRYKTTTKTAKEGLKLDDVTPKKGTASWYAQELSHFKDPSSKIVDEEKTSYQGLGTIPYEAAVNMGKWAEYDFEKPVDLKTKLGITQNDKFLPRNVLYNKYFNKHNISVITPNELAIANVETAKYYKSDGTDSLIKNKDGSKILQVEDKYIGNIQTDGYASKPGFDTGNDKTIKNRNDELPKITVQNDGDTKITNSNKFLKDKDGHTIYVARGKDGIHFMVIERSPFIELESELIDSTIGKDFNKGVDLDSYYTIYYPTEPGGNYPQYKNNEGKVLADKTTFINSSITDRSITGYKGQVKVVKDKLKSYNSNISKYIYDYLLNDPNHTFKFNGKIGEKIEATITAWINSSIKYSDEFESKQNWNKAWRVYYSKLESQAERRIQRGNADNGFKSQIVPDVCAYAIANGEQLTDEAQSALFGPGGIFYEAK